MKNTGKLGFLLLLTFVFILTGCHAKQADDQAETVVKQKEINQTETEEVEEIEQKNGYLVVIDAGHQTRVMQSGSRLVPVRRKQRRRFLVGQAVS